MREAVELPPGEDLNEWLAVNAVDFYNAIAVLYGTLAELCTRASCPQMSAGPKVRALARAAPRSAAPASGRLAPAAVVLPGSACSQFG